MDKAKIFKVLRIICAVISAACLAGVVFIFIYLGTIWGISDVAAAATFFVLTLLFKNLQEDAEKKNAPPPSPFIEAQAEADEKSEREEENK